MRPHSQNGFPPAEPGQATAHDLGALAARIRGWGGELGFQQIGIAGCDIGEAETRLMEWLARGWHGDMEYMAAHGTRRSRPGELVPGTLRVISARMNYFPQEARDSWEVINDGSSAYVARYAVGRDYHKVLRGRLQKLCDRIADYLKHADALTTESARRFAYRVFTDSAPVMEVELAAKAGIGWRGKHTLLLNRDAGSWFFLGEIYTDLPLPVDEPQPDHCGTCRRCIDVCPTGAIVAPYQLDARRCISYLTIEHKGEIPEELRPLIGNRIFGCDDCQLVCPWNRFAQKADVEDFSVRNGLDAAALTELFAWSEEEFERRLEGSAIRRIGHERWLRNLAVGLGNAPTSTAVVAALEARRDHPSALVKSHVAWALKRHRG
ncbi:MAG: tRNA epoxyqueuosine(34) reductase QueG [Burkholderiales bacterium]